MKFLIDSMLPLGLVVGLESRGHQAQHVNDVLGPDASDAKVFRHALETDAVLVSKDRDFIDMAEAADRAPQILLVRYGNATSKALATKLTSDFPEAEEKLTAGEPIVVFK